ncbi:MAG: hypothetical protein M5T52_15320 [Ignavibacteriaceae bacterium]|nr:hypothetical protein [Ignavibacteriaceae bacterium]
MLGFILGIPSAIDLKFLVNQDWVWGMGLILSGAFISFSIIKFGVNKFRTEIINSYGSDVKIGKWYNFVIGILVPIQVVALLSLVADFINWLGCRMVESFSFRKFRHCNFSMDNRAGGIRFIK